MAHFDVKELEKRKKEDLQKLANELGFSGSRSGENHKVEAVLWKQY